MVLQLPMSQSDFTLTLHCSSDNQYEGIIIMTQYSTQQMMQIQQISTDQREKKTI